MHLPNTFHGESHGASTWFLHILFGQWSFWPQTLFCQLVFMKVIFEMMAKINNSISKTLTFLQNSIFFHGKNLCFENFSSTDWQESKLDNRVYAAKRLRSESTISIHTRGALYFERRHTFIYHLPFLHNAVKLLVTLPLSETLTHQLLSLISETM